MLSTLIEAISAGLEHEVEKVLDISLRIDDDINLGYDSLSKVDAVGSTMSFYFNASNTPLLYFKNIELKNCNISVSTDSGTGLAGIIVFDSCILYNVKIIGGSNSQRIEIDFINSHVSFLYADSTYQGELWCSNSVIEYSVIDAGLFRAIDESFVNFSTINNAEIGDTAQVDDTKVSACTFRTLKVFGNSSVTSVLVTDQLIANNEMNTVMATIKRTSATAPNTTVVINACSLSTFHLDIVNTENVPLTTILSFSNSNDIAVYVQGENKNTTATATLVSVSNCNNISVQGQFKPTGITTGLNASGTNSVIRVLVYPLTYKIGRYTAGLSATSHVINTELLNTITHVFLQGANGASENYSNVSISGNQITITYSTATTADVLYEVYSAII